jgi:hypothetical protein
LTDSNSGANFVTTAQEGKSISLSTVV